MAQSSTRQRTLILGIVAVLLFAAIAPVCLMSPVVAMGAMSMPERGTGCDNGEASVSPCPYLMQSRTPGAAVVTGSADHVALPPLAALAPVLLVRTVDPLVARVTIEDRSPTLTPLRL